MGLFDRLNRDKQSKALGADEHEIKEFLRDFSKHDYLGKAAEAGRKAKDAFDAKEHDKAWGLLHEQKMFYMQHANRSGFDRCQILALDSQVHEKLANILRVEKKHDQALSHVLYWVIANNRNPIKRHHQKLVTYFRRCKFQNTSVDEAIQFSSLPITHPDYLVAQSKVAEWRARG